jgi:glycosyltransferase involved in cell wall biosynthesis
MKFLRLNEFLDQKTKFVNLEVINEASVNATPDKDIKFGICITTYKIESGGRQNHMSTEKILSESLSSIKDQKWKNWKVYVVGDGYPEDEWDDLVSKMKSIIPTEKLFVENMKTPGERGKYEGEILHLTGGNTAANLAIRKMKSDGIKYFARMDHDDAWRADHLYTHAQAYTQFPEVIYCLTQARKKRVRGDEGSYMYFPDKDSVENEPNNYTLGLGGQCHSAMTWFMPATNYIKYRTWNEQKSSAPRRKECFPGDWDNTERIKQIVENDNNDHKMIYVPKLTVKYRNSEGKF